jgi:two-component system invasion response regulator UvrY
MIRIYLIDDHAIVRDGLRAMLEAGGHRVVGEAADLTVALPDLPRLTPDLVLLDLKLKNHSGFELLIEVRKRALPVRCIVLTMSADPRDVGLAMRLGAAGYVLKDTPRAELLRAIDAVSRGEQHLGPKVSTLAAQALASSAEADVLPTLSPREKQIIKMVAAGKSSAMIGQLLHLSPRTVEAHRSRIMSKLGVSKVTGLVRFALLSGLIDVD